MKLELGSIFLLSRRVPFHLTLSFQCNFVMWNDSVRWNNTIRDSRKTDPNMSAPRRSNRGRLFTLLDVTFLCLNATTFHVSYFLPCPFLWHLSVWGKMNDSHQFYFEAEGKWLSLFMCGKLVAHNGISDKLITAGLSGIEGCFTFMHIAVCKRCTIHSI